MGINGNQDKWVRSKDALIGGVCDGIARNFGVQTWIVRLLWALSILCAGVGLFVYIALMFCLPREEYVHEAYQPKILGVCHEISLRTRVEVGVVRFLAVLLALLSLGTTVIGYIILYFVFSGQKNSRSTY